MSSVAIAGDTSGSVTLQAPAIAGTTVLTLPTTSGTILTTTGGVAPTTAGNVLFTTNGTSWSSTAKITQATVQNASGNNIDFTGVPSWVKRITVLYENVSTTGTDPVQIQLGYGVTPTYVNTGYTSHTFSYNSTTATSSSTGFVNDQGSSSGGASASRNGAITLYLQNASTNIWVSSGVIVTNNVTPSAGRVTIPGALTAVRITTTGGIQTFDSGTVNILYE